MPLLVRPGYNKPPNAYLLVFNNIARCRNPHSLAATHYGDNEQRKPAHDGRKATKRDQETVLLNPLRNKESPRKGNQATQNADHDEAVTGQLVVCVDELESKKAISVKSCTAAKPHFQDSTLT
jgi:hypothetical protein